MRLRSSLRRAFAAIPIAAAIATLPATGTAQAGFHHAAPTGAYLTVSPADATVNPIIVDLAGLGNTINLMPSGILRVAGYGSPDHEAVFCGVFSSSTELLSQYSMNRVTGAIGAIGAPECVTRNTFYYGLPTDIAPDFFISTAGLTVGVPDGARYLMIAVEDDQYADNVTATPGEYGVTVSSVVAVVPEPSTYAMMGIGLAGVLAADRRKRGKQSSQS